MSAKHRQIEALSQESRMLSQSTSACDKVVGQATLLWLTFLRTEPNSPSVLRTTRVNTAASRGRVLGSVGIVGCVGIVGKSLAEIGAFPTRPTRPAIPTIPCYGSEICTPAHAARGTPVVRIGVRPTSDSLLKTFSTATRALTLFPKLRLPNMSSTVARRSVNAFRSSSNCGPVTRSCPDAIHALWL